MTVKPHVILNLGATLVFQNPDKYTNFEPSERESGALKESSGSIQEFSFYITVYYKEPDSIAWRSYVSSYDEDKNGNFEYYIDVGTGYEEGYTYMAEEELYRLIDLSRELYAFVDLSVRKNPMSNNDFGKSSRRVRKGAAALVFLLLKSVHNNKLDILFCGWYNVKV